MRSLIFQLSAMAIFFVVLIYSIVLLTPQPEPVQYIAPLPEPVCPGCLTGTHNAINQNINLKVVFLRDINAVDQMARSFGYRFEKPTEFAEFTLTNTDVDCVVYLIHPRAIDDHNVLVLGHEVLHCVLGKYHP